MKKKKVWISIGLIAAVLFIFVTVFVISQRDNLIALFDSRRYDSGELAKKVEENKDSLDAALDEVLPQAIRDLTVEDELNLIMGEITEEEAIDKIQIPSENEEKTDEAAIENVIAAYVGELYGVKATYLGRLGALVGQAKAEFYALPDSQQTTASKTRIMSSYVGTAASLESQCDKKVSNILSLLQTALETLGGDTAIVTTLRCSYDAQKAAQKAYFLSLL